MAQWEIRRLFQLIRHEIFSVSPFLGSFMAPKCVPLGYCDEDRNRDEHCPIRPHKDNVLNAWADKKAAAKAAERLEQWGVLYTHLTLPTIYSV